MMGRIRLAWMGTVALLGMMLAASPAIASPGAAAKGPLEGHRRRGLGSSESTNWSGYAAYGTTFESARGSWVQPEAHCGSVAKHHYAIAAFWVGLDGYNDNTVEQTGTEADCEGAKPIYRAWWELYPKSSVLLGGTVRPGDQMHVRVTQDELVLEDITRAWKSKEGFLPGSLAFSSAEWIAEAPAKNALTNFGSVSFSGAAASSKALSEGPIESGAWSDDAITLVGGSHSTALAMPGPLQEAGRAFTISQGTASGVTHGSSSH